MAVTLNASTSAGLVQTADTSGILQLQTAGTAAVTVDASQNVGIGLTSLGNKFEVNGAINASTSTTTADAYKFSGWTLIGGNGYDLKFGGYTNGQFRQILFYGNDGSNVSSERMRIDSSGSVYIGTTSNQLAGLFQVSIAGDGMLAKTSGATNNIPYYAWNSFASGNNEFMRFYTDVSATQRGSISFNRAGTLTAYNTTSDQRLKENIVDAPSAINLINSVKIRSFDWKETGFHTDFGVVAQELNEVVPDAVTEGIDDENPLKSSYWSVDTSVLIPSMIKAIQEQQTIINDLTTRITALEGAA